MVDLLRSSCRDDMMILEVYGLTMAPVGGALVQNMMVYRWSLESRLDTSSIWRGKRYIESLIFCMSLDRLEKWPFT